MKLSVVIIAKNAQDFITDAIISVKHIADEIIVIDNESADKTKTIAEKEGAKVFPVRTLSFAELRNVGLEKAKGEWILYIDSDERVTKELAVSIKECIIREENKFSAYKLKRKNFYFGAYAWPTIEKLERLFKRNTLRQWYGTLHESPIVDGELSEINGFLLHYTHRDLTQMLEKTIEWSKTEAELRVKAGHPAMKWWRFPRVMLTAFFDSYVKQGGWKVGTPGFIEAMYQAYSMFITYARLWEMQQGKPTGRV